MCVEMLHCDMANSNELLLWNTETFSHSIDQSESGLETDITILKLMLEIYVISTWKEKGS